MNIKYLPCDKPKICKNCGAEFPNWVEIDGRRKNMQCRSYCFECSPFKGVYKHHSKYKTIDGVECRICSKCNDWKPVTAYYKTVSRRGNEHCQSKCKDCQNQVSRDLAAQCKRMAVQYKGEVCFDCKQSFPDYVYDFHHSDPAHKDFKISSNRVRRMPWAQIQAELDKCVLLCSNCHRRRHYDTNHPFYCPVR